MTPSIRSFTTQDFAQRTNSTVNVPAGVVNGSDYLIWSFAIIGGPGVNPTVSTPAGWTLLKDQEWVAYGSTATARSYVFARPASSEPANYTINHASMYSMSEMICIQSPNLSDILDVAAVSTQGTTSTAGTVVNAASVTPINDNSLIMVIRHGWDGAAATAGTGFTERVDHAAGYVQDMAQTTAGSTGLNPVPSGNTAGVGKPYVTFTLALRDSAAGDPPPYSPSWESQVALAVAGTAQARIMVVGNSFIEGEGVSNRFDRWLDKLVEGLRTTMGIVGTGVGHTPPRYNTYVIGVSDSWRVPATSSPTIGTKIFTRASGQYHQWPINGTGYTVIYSGGAGYGPYSVSTDGGAAETIAAQSTGKARRWDKTGLTAGAHTVRVTAGTGGGEVVGVQTYSGGDSPSVGLAYLDWSWSGATTAQFAPGGPYDVTGIQYGPHLVIDGKMGANDHLTDIETSGGTPAPTPTVVANRFEARVTEYRSWSSMPLVALFILPHMPVGSDVDETQQNSQGFILDDYRDAMIAKAEALDVPVIDCRELLTLSLSDLSSDNLHIAAAGQQVVADGIIDTLLNLSGYVPPTSFLGDAPVADLRVGDAAVDRLALGDAVLWSRGSV